ncbi:hypothetical protein B0H66DRAFT_639070 [Apodospora peruviana]|uniref:Enoyl reductase (ER) domain-containing protein n=1 Tax=Apodospora peruviana TaxID=516989 RepID=A0AAE0IEA6_9PEZI|nr:hypothetical protein B0H66DRAFT_639070 [Apodospora peruviana]
MTPPGPSRKLVSQYVALKQGGPFQLTSTPYPIPGPEEICVRNRAVGLNPLDVKTLYQGLMPVVQKWPEVLGIDAAGVVEAVGDNVTDFKAGDAVFSLAGFGGKAGAFQDVMVVPTHFAAKKPSSWTFEEASSVPICYLAAAACLLKGLSLRLPFMQDPPKDLLAGPDRVAYVDDASNPPSPNIFRKPSLVPAPPPNNNDKIRSILVLGGSSGVGSSAIQLLRQVLGPAVTILSTNSPANNTHLMKLGATACINRNDNTGSKLVSAIKAATPDGKGVDAILDAVSAAEADKMVFEALSSRGPKLYCQVMTGPGKVDAPNDVRAAAQPVFGRMTFEAPGGRRAMSRLAELVEAGNYKLPLRVEVVGKGLEAIPNGLEKLRDGVSGTKLVVSL